MSEDDIPSEDNPFEEFLRGMLGDDAAREASRAMREQGFDAASMSAMLGDPNQLHAALGQFRYFFGSTTGPVNWKMAVDMAKQQVFQEGDPTFSAAEAQSAREALTVADLWLDPVTELSPGSVERQAWTRTQWIDQTLPVWKRLCEPVAQNVSRALTDALTVQFGDFSDEGSEFGPSLPAGMAELIGRSRDFMPRLAAMMFSFQIGHALAELSGEAMSSTDVGLPLCTGQTALLLLSIGNFGDDLDIPFNEIQQFVAVRECAHQRLFASVPWLSAELIRSVELYSAEIAIDTDAINDAAMHLDPTDPTSLTEGLGQGVFSAHPTEKQKSALERLETLLALVEGWVERVTANAIAPYLPHGDHLRELMRRRRATGGPAEQLFGQLIGLQMRPRRAREAAKLFTLVEEEKGADARDDLWQHPDMAPTARDLDVPEYFLISRKNARAEDAAIDAALEQLLEGTLGWAEGLSPNDDPESESLRQAGFDVDEDGSSAKDAPEDEGDAGPDTDGDTDDGSSEPDNT